jgi:hypothetical protein
VRQGEFAPVRRAFCQARLFFGGGRGLPGSDLAQSRVDLLEAGGACVLGPHAAPGVGRGHEIPADLQDLGPLREIIANEQLILGGEVGTAGEGFC